MPVSQHLTLEQMALAALLLVFQIILAILLRLGLARTLIWAGIRMALQLSLIGLILTYVFAVHSWLLVLSLITIMTVLAGYTAVSRVKHRYSGIYLDGIISIFASAWLTTSYFLLVVNHPEPWYLPQYVIPLMGMILGNGLSGIALGLDRFLASAQEQKELIETWLSLGATSSEACKHIQQEAIRTGLIPIINSMLASGMVSIPGMMTGQILGGIPPIQAVQYQIIIMLMISSSTTLGTIGTVLLAQRRLFTKQVRFNQGLIRDTA